MFCSPYAKRPSLNDSKLVNSIGVFIVCHELASDKKLELNGADLMSKVVRA